MANANLPALIPQVYEHEQFGKIRVVKVEDDVKFFGTDAATALGYTNPTKAVRDHIPDKFKLTEQIVLAGQRRTVTLISEEGLYRLAFRSRLPEAEKFTDWAAEIMVSVRKTGSYTLPESDPRAIFTPTYIRQIADRIESLENHNLLHKLEIQFKTGKVWVLYQIYAGLGYMKTVTKILQNGLTVTQNYWTQKGRMFLYSALKKADVLPLVERKNPMATLPGMDKFTWDGGFAPRVM